MLLGISPQAEVADGGGHFPVEVPFLTIFSAVEIQKILQHLGGADQLGIQFFSEIIAFHIAVGYVGAAPQVVGGKYACFFHI